MTTKSARGRLFGVLSVLSLLIGITLVSSVKAQAQQYPYGQDDQGRRDRNRDPDNDGDDDRGGRRRRHDRDRDADRDRNNGYYNNGRYNNGRYGNGSYGGYGGYGNRGNNIYRMAADRGYQDGIATGQEDAYRGQSYDPQRSHYYKNGTYGYDSSYGNKNAYKQAYRDGFVQGYRQGYSRNGRYGRGTYNRGGILGGIFGRP
jgi:hypothetical protein